ncbi:MAG: hypothetical protein HC812_16220 [Leptolyngbya sp. RL_3_1]|nr:hypothetical protein [Leptolyngbya sp. RL_3_1]
MKAPLLPWLLLVLWSNCISIAQALPPPEDIPEEILRTEIITEGRSPLTGESLTAAGYAQLQEQLQETDIQRVPDNLRQLIFLLQIRRILSPLAPILP